MLVASQVVKIYNTGTQSVEALRRVNLSVNEAEFVAVMGPSGSGKTTLLNCLSGLDSIDEGTVTINGNNIHKMADVKRTKHRAATMGFIFQAFNLIPVFSAVENVELPLLLNGVNPRDARKQASETLEKVGLNDRLNHKPAELSGGEQQRVTVARALAGHPKLVWADEPTGNLDSESAEQVIKLLKELNSEGLTLILVTHDQQIGNSAGRKITFRDGEIIKDEKS